MNCKYNKFCLINGVSMKKYIKWMLCLIVLLPLIGCSNEVDQTIKEEKVIRKVCFLVNGEKEDGAYFASALSGLEDLVLEDRIVLDVVDLSETKTNEAYIENLENVSKSHKYDLIICSTNEMEEALHTVANQYKDQYYLIFDSDTYANIDDNVLNIVFKTNELGYLTGAFASSFTHELDVDLINKKRVIGFMGVKDEDVMNDFLFGYLKAVKDYGKHTSVVIDWVDSYQAIDQAQSVTEDMLNSAPVDVVWGVCGQANQGIGEACLNSGKAWLIGIDTNQEETLRQEVANVTITSATKNMKNAIYLVFNDWDEEKLHFGRCLRLGIKEGGVTLVDSSNYDHFVSGGTKGYVNKTIKNIKLGKIVVPSMKDVNATQQLQSLIEKVSYE